MCACVAADVVETLSCSSCHVTFSDVDQLSEHSARQCVTSQVDGGQCSSELGERDDRVDSAASSADVPAADDDDSGRESTVNTSNVNDAIHDADIELDTAAQPQLPQSNMRPSPSFDGDNDNDDEHFDASDDYAVHSLSSSQSAAQFDKVFAPETDATLTGRQRLSVVEGHVMNDRGPSPPKTSSSTLTNVTQLIDNNVSPASKIAMLESVVYALHQQQMFQLELIEALRRQLATALAASSSRPPDDNTNTTLDLTLPRSSETTVLDHGSSLSSLMRLSSGVDARRAPPAGVRSPSTSPTTLSGSMLDGHDAAMSSGWPAELALNKSRIPPASLPSPLLATPKHGPALADLNLFRKGE